MVSFFCNYCSPRLNQSSNSFNGGIFADELLRVTPYRDSATHFDNFDQFKFGLV